MPTPTFGNTVPSRPDRLEHPNIGVQLADRVPLLAPTLHLVSVEQLALISQVVGDATTHEAVRLVLNLALNDFRDLLDDLAQASGRAGMRAARSVIEHGINFHTIISDLSEASRYLEHLDLGPTVLLDLSPGLERFQGKQQREYLRTLRREGAPARRRFQAAVREHGTWFSRGWTPKTVRERAKIFGLNDLYDYYRVASLVSHGSSAGSLGTLHDGQKGLRTLRTGSALQLAPVAMWAGIAGYRSVLRALQEVRPDLPVDAYTEGLDALDGLWADYSVAVHEIDRRLWPTQPLEQPSAVLAFTPTKARRWYLHLPMTHSLIRAEVPQLPTEVEQQLTMLIDRVIREQPQFFGPDQRWVAMRVAHVTVKPMSDGAAIPDTALFHTSSEGFELLEWK